MLLALDAGNTNITVGVFDNDKIVGTFRLNTQIARTSDEFGILIIDLLTHNKIDAAKVNDVIISSVVPKIMHSLINGIRKYFKVDPIIIQAGIKTGIKVKTASPADVGADRIVDLAGAYGIYGGPALVIDYGTATTYDYVDVEGNFEFGVTSPGIRTSAKALSQDAAKLPEIEIKMPDTILVRSTVTSMQAGLIYGYIGQTEYIIDKMKEATGVHDMKVIATGGLGRIIADNTEKIDIYDPDLTLKGMKLIFDKNR
ncbi:MAG: type III pantothenate kinase [Lachnospiraceae bacterium]|nr:type III pantothenate kinase [Lachnospiraceae bacterium]